MAKGDYRVGWDDDWASLAHCEILVVPERHPAPDELALLACEQLQALLHAARLVEAEAEEQQWTRTDPVELPGLLRAAGLLRTAATWHVETEHRHGVAPHS